MFRIVSFYTKSVAFLLLFSSCLFSESDSDMERKLKNYFFSPDVTSLNVSDWNKPTLDDYRKIQNFVIERAKTFANTPLSSRPFPTDFLNDEFYQWIINRYCKVSLVGKDNNSPPPASEIICFNNDPNNKKNCIICYSSYSDFSPNNRDFLRGMRFIRESLKKQNFDGHFLYHFGGWPGLKRGRLKYADVPYAFKLFLFEEAKDLGYENVLWLDASVVPVKNLTPVFDLIQKNGLCYYGIDWNIPWSDFNKAYKLIMPSVNLDKNYKQIYAQVVGLNLKDPRGLQLLDEWIKAAERKVPFLTGDQIPLSFLVSDLNLMHGQLPSEYIVETFSNTGNFEYWKANPKAILYHQYDFVNPSYNIPNDLFDH